MNTLARRTTAAKPASTLAAALAAATAMPIAHGDTADLERRIAELERRVGGAGAGGIAWSGLGEVEAAAGENFQGVDRSGFELATLELGAEAAVNDWVSSGAVLLYEGGTPADVEVDAATITIAPPAGGWQATFGRTYVPFGMFETRLVSDTLPLELGESQETAAVLGIGNDALHASAYVFNGASNDGGEDEIEHFGARVGASGGGETVSWAVGADYLSSIADSDGLTGSVSAPATLNDYVAGYAVHGRAEAAGFTLLAEYLAAADAFEPGELAFGGSGAEPAAWQAEIGYGFAWSGMPATAVVGLQGTEEALALGLPETRTLVGISIEPWEATGLSVEWAADEDYATADGGTGESADTLTLQLATAF